ncbi:hypothetical protein NDU88_009430 [Pleurodeles waltl]|uniref:Uncharacterized protein n=1 Tax=Pleurodeles waltl TaxID=8319 RepID=A0AAV7QVS2_PLEWA|nr:hypothetical protein NDU88_009430 [Pleurodeles waltl]
MRVQMHAHQSARHALLAARLLVKPTRAPSGQKHIVRCASHGDFENNQVSAPPDPHNSIACAASATTDPEATGDTDALVGWWQQPRELPQVKGGVSLLPGKEVVGWSRKIPELLATEDQTDREDAEPGVTETAVRTSVTTGQSGVEKPQRRTEDRWPRGAYA